MKLRDMTRKIRDRMGRLAPGLMVASALLYSGCGKHRSHSPEKDATPAVPAKETRTSAAKRKRNSGTERASFAGARTVSEAWQAEANALESSPTTPTHESADEQALRDWIQRDPAGAAAWAIQTNGSEAGSILKAAAAAWANADLSSARKWLEQLPEGDAKSTAAMAIAYEMARTHPTDALRLAVDVPASRERDDLLAHTVSQWAQTDAAAAGAWAKEVPEAALRQQLLAAIAIAQAEQDGSAAATLVSTGLPEGPEQDRAAVSVVQTWAQSAPQAAAEWVLQFPSTPTRTSAVRSLVAIWATSDAAGAAKWLGALPAGPDRDAAESAYAQAVATADLDSESV